jgi:hypothetical protein
MRRSALERRSYLPTEHKWPVIPEDKCSDSSFIVMAGHRAGHQSRQIDASDGWDRPGHDGAKRQHMEPLILAPIWTGVHI